MILVDPITLTRIGFAMAATGCSRRPWPGSAPARGRRRMTLMFAGLVLLMAAFVPLSEPANLVSSGTLFGFLLASAAVPVRRRTRPDLERPFRVPFSRWSRSCRRWPAAT